MKMFPLKGRQIPMLPLTPTSTASSCSPQQVLSAGTFGESGDADTSCMTLGESGGSGGTLLSPMPSGQERPPSLYMSPTPASPLVSHLTMPAFYST
jgi:hypothetical protein